MIKVLFVCLGNICRSPMAEAIFQHLVDEAGLSEEIAVDSAGTGSWHVGEPAHPGTRQVLTAHQITYNGRARQVRDLDMQSQDGYIIVMDLNNKRDLEERFGPHPRLHTLMEFATKTDEINVPDPYYTNNFDYVFDLVNDGCQGLLRWIRDSHDI